jgi:hypothetical protein
VLVGAIGSAFLPRQSASATPILGAGKTNPAKLLITCQPNNDITLDCSQLNSYIAACGVICPDGQRLLGKGGCTNANASANRDPYDISFSRAGAFWCASATVTATFSASPQSSTINFTQSPKACCPQTCTNEINAVEDQLKAHEQAHVKNINAAIADANKLWRNRAFTQCAMTKTKAKAALSSAVTSSYDNTIAALEKKFAAEPAQARPIDCTKCTPASSNQTCCKGACVNLCPNGAPPDPATCACPNLVYCNCNQTCYSDVTTCLNNCHVTLGCFTGICGPAQPGQC